MPDLLASVPAALDEVMQAGIDCGVDEQKLQDAIEAGTGG